MLLTRALPAAGLLSLAGCLVSALAADPTPAATPARLPLTRVTLYTAGVGHFHRQGTVDGTARVDVRVAEEDVNDLIKTLVATDAGGTARAVTYDNKAPAEVTLKAFQIDLTDNPSVAGLLRQVRGEKVEVTDRTGATTAGTIVSVEVPEAKVITPPTPEPADDTPVRPVKPVVVPPPADAVEQVNLLTDDGVQGVPLAKAKRVRFVKPELQAEFRKALEALAAARGAATKTVGVTFAGAGKRAVSLGYVTEAPLWKPTYRVTLGGADGGAGAKVEGWAAVENTTDEDWENVKLSLVSGRPVTYRMDLYDPLFVPRPLVEPELYASLRPPLYQGNAGPGMVAGVGMQGLGAANFTGGFGGGQLGNAANLGVAGGVFGITGGMTGSVRPPAPSGLTRPSLRGLTGNRLDYDEFKQRLAANASKADPAATDPVSAARPGGASADFGQSFRYDVAEPVSLPRFKSALLPVVTETAGVERVSVYNPALLPGHPMLGVRLTNKGKQFLAQGPVAVFDGDGYAGDARLPDVQPGETRLLSYAIDLDVRVAEETVATRTPARVAIVPAFTPVDGLTRDATTLFETTVVRETTKYRLVNRSAATRTVLVTRPARPNWRLVAPDKPTDRTPDLYRFEVKVGPGTAATFDVAEETTETRTTTVSDLSADAIDGLILSAATPAAVKAGLAQMKAFRTRRADAERDAVKEEAALKEITAEQARIRENIARVPKDSQAYQRYLKKFDDQETEIERRQARIKELRQTAEKEKQALDEFLRSVR